jgi:hypothetical protein
VTGPPYSQTVTATEINGHPNTPNPLDYSPQSLDQFTLIGDFRNLTISDDAPDGVLDYHGYHTDNDVSGVNITIEYLHNNMSPPAVDIMNIIFVDSFGYPNELTYVVGVQIPSKYLKVIYDGTYLNIFDENGLLLTTTPFSGASLVNYNWVFSADYNLPTVSGSCVLGLNTYPPTPAPPPLPSGPSLSDVMTDVVTSVVSVIRAIAYAITSVAIVIGEVLLFIGLFGKMTIIWTKVLTWFNKGISQRYY